MDCYCCWRAFLLLAIDRQPQSSSNSEAVVRCSQQRRGQQSASMCLRVPVARCCCHADHYAPGTQLLARLAAVCRHFLKSFLLRTQEVEPIPALCVKALIPSNIKHVIDTMSLAQISYDDALTAVYPTVAAAVHYRTFPTANRVIAV